MCIRDSPLAAAAILATLDIYRREDLFGRARKLSGAFEQAAHSLKGAPHAVSYTHLDVYKRQGPAAY